MIKKSPFILMLPMWVFHIQLHSKQQPLPVLDMNMIVNVFLVCSLLTASTACFQSRNILFSHVGKDTQNFHIASLSGKCYYYSNAICSWLTSFALQGEFSFVSHLIWLAHYFQLISHVKAIIPIFRECTDILLCLAEITSIIFDFPS